MNGMLRSRKVCSQLIFFIAAVFLFMACQKRPIVPIPDASANQKAATNTNASIGHIPSTVATDWFKLELRMILHANPATNGALNAEYFAYTGIGLYEAVRPGIKNSVSLSNSLNEMPQMPQVDNNGYDLVVSANAVLASLIRHFNTWLTAANKASIDSLENAYNQNAPVAMGSEKFIRSQAYGRAVAAAIIDWAKTDNYNVSNAGYVLPVIPFGVYIPTPPSYSVPILPYVSLARPLLIEDGSGVCPPPPFPYSETPGSDFYKMVKDIYDVSKVLTTDQRNMALYWADLGVGIGYTPQGHDINVAVEAVEQSGVDLGIAAEGFAKAGIAIRESILTTFRSKYQYLQIRPVSYIRKVIDAGWSSLITTPSHPEYPAAHADISGAVMRALAHVLGSNTPVVDHTYDFRGFAPRAFPNLDAVAEESGNSRRYGGIHYMPSIIVGWAHGRGVGDLVGNIQMENKLTP